jgi:FdhE protein
MTDSTQKWDSALVEKAVSQVAAKRPAYASILDFYGPVFAAQVNSVSETSPETILLDASRIELAATEGFSLIEPAAFGIDIRAAEKLLDRICRAAVRSGEKLSAAGEALIRAMNKRDGLADLLTDVLHDQDRIRETARNEGLSPDMLSLLLYLAIKPSVETGSLKLTGHLTEDHDYRTYCPVCGSGPIVGELDVDGKRWFHCGFCWCRWPVLRMGCPFCNNRDASSLEYFYADDEPEYRVDSCGRCGRYLKVIDVRKLDRLFYPPLEQVVTLHLDMLAAKKGFVHGGASKPSDGDMTSTPAVDS